MYYPLIPFCTISWFLTTYGSDLYWKWWLFFLVLQESSIERDDIKEPFSEVEYPSLFIPYTCVS